MKMYYNLVKHLNGKPTLLPTTEQVEKYIDQYSDFYRSVYDYSEKDKKAIEEASSISGISDVTTNRIIFDLDDKNNLQQAKDDAVTLIRKLLKLGLSSNQLRCYFSGGKGFHIEFDLDRRITPKEHKAFAFNLAGDLKTFDPVVYNAARIIRVANTKHQTTGLYKVPLSIHDLRDKSVQSITEAAVKQLDFKFERLPVTLPTELFQSKEIEREVVLEEIDWSKKPRWLSNCRYALQNGLFKEGMRSNALSCLAATYKNQGFTQEHTLAFLKSVTELQAKLNNTEVFPEEELEQNVITPVYSTNWKGGIYTCKEQGWLQTYCNGLKEHSCNKHEQTEITRIDSIVGLFDNYVNDLDKNILYSGIESLDKRIKLMVGTSNAIVAPPGAGKTSLATQILNHNSEIGINSMIFSYDMFHSALYLRLIQRHTSYTQDQIFEIFKYNKKEKQRIQNLLNEQYRNVHFCFKAGQTIEDLEMSIVETEQKIGDKIKLVVIDYNELVIAKSSDPTQSSAEVAQAMRRIANERQVCIISLLQPSKFYSNPADEVTSHNSAKGSGAIAQSVTTMLGCSRPGFNPLIPETDQYFTITCLKNRNGPLFTKDFRWDGLPGIISELEDGDAEVLKQLRQIRDAKKTEGF